MVDKMSKCEYRFSDGYEIRDCCSGFRWPGRCSIRVSFAALVERYCPDRKWKTTFLRRYRGQTAKLCQKDCTGSGYAGCKRICCSIPVCSSKWKKVLVARTTAQPASITDSSCFFDGPCDGPCCR